jgi:hypothetical protein
MPADIAMRDDFVTRMEDFRIRWNNGMDTSKAIKSIIDNTILNKPEESSPEMEEPVVPAESPSDVSEEFKKKPKKKFSLDEPAAESPVDTTHASEVQNSILDTTEVSPVQDTVILPVKKSEEPVNDTLPKEVQKSDVLDSTAKTPSLDTLTIPKVKSEQTPLEESIQEQKTDTTDPAVSPDSPEGVTSDVKSKKSRKKAK